MDQVQYLGREGEPWKPRRGGLLGPQPRVQGCQLLGLARRSPLPWEGFSNCLRRLVLPRSPKATCSPPWGQQLPQQRASVLSPQRPQVLESTEVLHLCLPHTWQVSKSLAGKVSTRLRRGHTHLLLPAMLQYSPAPGAHPGHCSVTMGSRFHIYSLGRKGRTGRTPPHSALDTRTDSDVPGHYLCHLTTYFLMANTVSPMVTFWTRNCSFRMSMLKVPSQTMGASQGVRTRTSFLLHQERATWQRHHVC